MQQTVDLHTHSTYSDGSATPEEIIQKAVAIGLQAVALTDHNTVAGLPDFLKASRGKDILAVPGVEISTEYDGTELHIVGLFLEPEYFAQTTAFLNEMNLRKDQSNRDLIQALNQAGYDLDYDQIKGSHQGTVNRAVIAAELLKKGYISTIKEAFKGLLSEENGYYVPPKRLSSFEAISFLRSVHAIPVLAHPFLDLTEEELRVFLQKAKTCGLMAMETRYSTWDQKTTDTAIRIAEEFGLLQSGGSDYHGTNKIDIHLGTGKGSLAVPRALLDKLIKHK